MSDIPKRRRDYNSRKNIDDNKYENLSDLDFNESSEVEESVNLPKKKKKKKRRFLKFIFNLFLIFILLIAGLLTYGYVTAKPMNILVLGSDAREGEEPDSTRADSLMILRVDPKKREIVKFSIPRDTIATLACGDQVEDRINHSLAFGGLDCTEKTVENLFDIEIDYHFFFNFSTFEIVVDDVGGVDVVANSTFSEPSITTGETHTFEEGQKYHMDGDMALSYARHRKTDSDFVRGERQQQIIEAIISEINIANAFNLLNSVLKQAETNFNIISASRLFPILFGEIEIKTIELRVFRDSSFGKYLVRLEDENIAEVHEKFS